jgi:Rod binding domain-containing protein
MTDLSSLGALSSLLPPDFNVSTNTIGHDETTRIKQVSKAMETLFANQLSEQLGKEIEGSDSSDGAGGSDNPGSGADVYGDFIQQAMSQGLTSGRGLGLAHQIEDYLNRREHPMTAPYMHPALHHAQPAH